MLIAHVLGMPIEEMAAQWFAPVGVSGVALAIAWLRERAKRRRW